MGTVAIRIGIRIGIGIGLGSVERVLHLFIEPNFVGIGIGVGVGIGVEAVEIHHYKVGTCV